MNEEILIAEVASGEQTATMIAVSDEVMDGWTMRIFPTLDSNRVILGIAIGWLREIRQSIDNDEDIDRMEQYIVGEGCLFLQNYFDAIQ